jgi:hypothetical protein
LTLAAHFSDKAKTIDNWRVQGRPIRVLIDAVDLKPHTLENQGYVERASARIYEPTDRVATKVASGLVKMQMRRALVNGQEANFFVSEKAAIMRLMTDYTVARSRLPQLMQSGCDLLPALDASGVAGKGQRADSFSNEHKRRAAAKPGPSCHRALGARRYLLAAPLFAKRDLN